jgi:hypothetical protein
MSARLCVLAAVLVASIASAATPFTDGCQSQSDTGRTVYANKTTGCTAVNTCSTNYAACLPTSETTVNCTRANECIGKFLTCLNGAVDSTGCGTVLADLKLSLLSVTNGERYNLSAAYKSCVATSCALVNESYSGGGANCTLDVTTLCVSPVNFIATLLLRGSFTAILADAGKRSRFEAALVSDLIRALNIDRITIRRMYIAGSKRQALQTLVVEVQVPGVSANNAAFAAAFTALKNSGSSWATSANAVYRAETGQDLVVLGVGAGGASSAFSSIPIPTTASPSTAAPTTRSPTASTTGSPGATSAPPSGPSNTTRSPTGNTPAPPPRNTTRSPATASPSTGSSSSGASARSLVAAAAIAVLSAAFLF